MTAPPALNNGRHQVVPPRPAIRPATGALPKQLPHYWPESKAGLRQHRCAIGPVCPWTQYTKPTEFGTRYKAAANRRGNGLDIVDAGLHEPSRNTVRLGIRPATVLGDVPVHPVLAPTPSHTMPVWVTGYTLTGATALGTSAGPGICAVDPAFIFLGTRITISGVGTCVAQDTGPGVLGAHIDVWVPTVSQAYAITGWHTASW